jgi:hypothetical protein
MSMWEHVTLSVVGFNRSSPSGEAEIFRRAKSATHACFPSTVQALLGN